MKENVFIKPNKCIKKLNLILKVTFDVLVMVCFSEYKLSGPESGDCRTIQDRINARPPSSTLG